MIKYLRALKNRITVKEAAAFLTLFLMLYVSNETLLFGTNSSHMVKTYGFFVLTVLTLAWTAYALFYAKNDGLTAGMRNAAIALVAIIFCTAFANGGDFFKYSYEGMLLLLTLVIVSNIGFKTFKECFCAIMIFLACASLAGMALYMAGGSILNKMPVMINTSGYKFHNILFTMVQGDNVVHSFRNYGIFREPGAFVVFLCIALFFELVDNKRYKNYKVFLYILTVFTTFSTAGYILMALVLFGYFLSKSETPEDKKLKKTLLIGMGVGLFGLILFFDFQALFSKVFGKLFVGNASRDSRVGAFLVNVALLLKQKLKFIFGGGFSYVESNYRLVSVNGIMSDHNTNTLFKMLSVHGVVYFLIVVLSLAEFVRGVKKGQRGEVFYTLALIMMLCNEDFIFNIVVYLLIFYSIQQNQGESFYANLFNKFGSVRKHGKDHAGYFRTGAGIRAYCSYGDGVFVSPLTGAGK